MRITYLGHSAVMIMHEGFSVLIDPFLSDNPLAPVAASTLDPDLILLTHGHHDHVGDALSIAKRTQAPVVAAPELIALLEAEGLPAGKPLNIGGTVEWQGGRARMVQAVHSSSYGDRYAGEAAGYLIDWGGMRLYHAGDTALFGDMKLFSAIQVDLAMLPIGGVYTMDARDALDAVRWIQPARVMPMHCNTFPQVQADPDRFVFEVNENTGCRGLVLSPGASLELS